MTETPLAADSPQFTLFQEACAKRELLRIRYLQPVINDPALPEEMRQSGIPTTVEGNAIAIDEQGLTFTQAVASIVPGDAGTVAQVTKMAQRMIPRAQILEIEKVGESEPVIEPEARPNVQVVEISEAKAPTEVQPKQE